jgi:ATP-binding cassette subfamily B (MDR/TAP) protein 10
LTVVPRLFLHGAARQAGFNAARSVPVRQVSSGSRLSNFSHILNCRRRATDVVIQLRSAANGKAVEAGLARNGGTVKMPTSGKKPVPKASDVYRLLSLAKPEKWRLAAAVGFLFISSAVTMAVPFGIGRVIDIIYTTAKDGDMVGRLTSFCEILLAIFLFGALANFGRIYIMQTSGIRIIRSLRCQLFSSIIRQEMAFFDRNKTGELINRLSTDTSLVGQSVTMNISDGLRSVVQALAGVSMMVFMSPKLSIIALSIVPPVAVLSRIYGRYVQGITKQVQDSLADATQVAEERLANMRTVRAFVQEVKETNVYNSRIDSVLRLSYKEALARGIFWAMTGLSGNLIILSVFYYGGIMMNESQITVGELSSFLMYAAFVGISIGGLSSFYTELMRGIGASSRLWELVDRKPSIPLTEGKIPSQNLIGTIEFRNIQFSYPARSEVSVLNGLNLVVPSGSITAIVGSSGSGKSTLPALLMRFYDPNHGGIFIDGADIREYSPQWLRSHMGIVNQEPTLFSTTIAENILYGAVEPTSVSQQQIIDAAKMANADSFIQRFPRGFDTVVGERGVMLSGGQKQRIAIARAIIKNPRILLLDEATSALDAESEYFVQEALERVMVGRTVMVIAHRLSTIKNANQIAVLEAGQIVEVGSYERLMTIPDGMFRKLVERQTIVAQ